MDVSAFGTSTGFSPPVPPTEGERPRPLDIAREVGVGAAGGAFELWWDATKDFVLFWATGGVYNGIKIWSAIYAGYKEGGSLGALNVLNPIYAIMAPAAKSTQAAVDGDYRAAGREGVKALATLAITVVTIALGPKGPGPGGKNGPGQAGTGAAQLELPFTNLPRASLPPYSGGKVSGVLQTPGNPPLPLTSGVNGPSQAVRGKGLPGFNGNQITHVEGHAAAHMRVNGIKNAVLDINKVPCSAGPGGGARGSFRECFRKGQVSRFGAPETT